MQDLPQVFQLNNIRVFKQAHNLQFSVLVSLILQHLLYRNSFASFQALGLKESSEEREKQNKKVDRNYLATMYSKWKTFQPNLNSVWRQYASKYWVYLIDDTKWTSANHTLCHIWHVLEEITSIFCGYVSNKSQIYCNLIKADSSPSSKRSRNSPHKSLTLE